MSRLFNFAFKIWLTALLLFPLRILAVPPPEPPPLERPKPPPAQIASSEGMAPLPVPVVPQKRQEKKNPPVPPVLVTKVQSGDAEDWTRTPDDIKELCDECEMPEDKLIEALRFRSEPISLSEPLREDGDAELGDVVEDRSAESPFDVAAVKMMPAAIEKFLQLLDDRERRILRMRFGLDGAGEVRTLEDVGAEMNLTRERIRQIEARAMSKLRHPSSDTGARDLLTL